MDLEFSADEAQLRDTVADMVAGLCPPSVVRGVFEGTGTADEVWRKMVELGWPAMAIPEQYGGVGMGYLELAIVAEQIGRACVPGPFMATATQFAAAVGELGTPEARASFLPAVAAGEITGTLAIAEGAVWEPSRLATAATPVDGGWSLSGTKSAVLDGATADEIVVIARAHEGLGAFCVPRSQCHVTERAVMDLSTPLADLVLDGVVVPDDRVIAVPSAGVEVAVERVLDMATVAVATAMVATCREIFDRTLAYAKERVQYDRPIGSFQALKHRFADMYLAVERAASLCWFAALAIAEDDPRRSEARSLAKAAAGECQQVIVQDGLQLHGGIGFTWEHDLHFFLKRAKSGDALFGNAIAHRSRIARLVGLVAAPAEEAAA